MALVECGLCGWSHEVDETLPPEAIELTAKKHYAEHMLNSHSDIARSDPVVREYAQTVAAVVAPTNGVVVKKND